MSEEFQGTAAPAAMEQSILSTGVPAPQAAPATAPSTEPRFVMDGWLKGIDESIAHDPSLKDIQDLPNLAKSYVNAQKLLGRDKLVLPTEYATPDEWKAVYEKLGVPKDPKEYQFKTKFEYEDEYVDSFKTFAKENGLLPRQAEAILAKMQNEDQAMETAREQEGVQARDDGFNLLKQEYGQALEPKLNLARHTLAQIADENMASYVEESGLANDPQFIKFLVNIGEKFFKEDGVNPQSRQSGNLSPSEAQTKINETMGNMEHPYWNESHPGHQQAVADMAKLYNYASN